MTHITDIPWRLAHHHLIHPPQTKTMTISELIARLESFKAEHGDIACVIRDSDHNRRTVKGIKHLDRRPSPWKDRAQPIVEIHP